ncbi:MAG TPA: SLATT domain-containing protein [Actinomycetota bacterium]|nr:SLATT domain-containing protein [Actinomycetota bacterium]
MTSGAKRSTARTNGGRAAVRRPAAEPPRETIAWPEAERLLAEWHLRITTAQFGHQLQAERTRVWNLALGIPVVVATTIVGTSAFAALNNTGSHDSWKIAAGVLSIFAAVLAALQTFLGFGDRAERHRIAATRYASIRRAIELALTRHDTQEIDKIRIDMDRVGGPSPQIGHRRWDEATVLAKRQIARWRRGEADLEGPADPAS